MIKWLIGLLVLASLSNADQGAGQQIKPRLDCKTLGDGNYVYGCNKVFWMCSNGNLHSQHCLNQLFFDPETNACEHARNIDLCNHPNDTLATIPTRAVDPFSCKGKPDKIYAFSKCGQGFIHCAADTEVLQLCPGDLVFDEEHQYCEEMGKVKACEGKKDLQRRTLPNQLGSSLPSGAAPGYGPQESVQQDFPGESSSSYGPQIKQQQHQASFQPRQSYASSASAQQQQPVAPPRSSYSQQSEIQQTPAKPDFDCSSRQDGTYPSPLNACETFFWRCLNGKAMKYQCPISLYFSTQKVHCDLHENVPECNGNIPPYPNKPLVPNSIQTNEQPLIGVPASQVQQQQPAASKNNYGQQQQVQQPAPQQQQQQPVAPKGYQQQQPQLAPQAPPRQPQQPQQPQSNYGQQTQSPATETQLQQPQPALLSPYGQPTFPQQNPQRVVYNCVGKADGFYELGKCHTKYIRCVHGTAYPQECPQSLVFSGELCDYKDNCLNPTHPPPPQQQPPVNNQIQTPYGKPSIQRQPPMPTQPAETFCQDNNLSDGYQSQGCSNHYFVCSPQNTLRLNCPGTLFYDAETQKCEYKYHIVACGGRKLLKPAQTQPIRPATPYGQNQNQQSTQQQPAVNFQPQQAYGQPQAQQQSIPQPQQPQQSYNQQPAPQQQQQQPIDRPQTQQSYGQQPQPAQQQPAFQPQQTQQTYGQQQMQQPQQPIAQPQKPQTSYPPIPLSPSLQQAPPKPIENFCRINGRQDGFNGEGCSAHFFVCALGETTRMHCPIGLYYDIDTNECSHKNLIVACGGKKATPAPAQQQSSSGRPYGQQQQVQQQLPPSFDCRTRKDGVYANGCSPKHYICIKGNVRSQTCPTGTFYSGSTELCDLSANVVECGGVAQTLPPVAQLPVLLPKTSYGPQPAAQQQQPSNIPAPAWVPYPYQSQGQVQQNPTVAVTPQPVVNENKNPCESLSNGIYGRKCNRFFLVCTDKNAYDFICPKDQAFNLQTVKCAPKTEISTCPEFVAPARQPTILQPQQSYGQQPVQQQHVAPPQQPQQTYGQPQAPQQQPPVSQPQQTYQQQPAQQQPILQPRPQESQQTYNQGSAQQQPIDRPQPQQPQQSYGQPQPQVQQQPPAPQLQQTYLQPQTQQPAQQPPVAPPQQPNQPQPQQPQGSYHQQQLPAQQPPVVQQPQPQQPQQSYGQQPVQQQPVAPQPNPQQTQQSYNQQPAPQQQQPQSDQSYGKQSVENPQQPQRQEPQQPAPVPQSSQQGNNNNSYNR